MNVVLLGSQDVDFITKEGHHIVGTNIFVGYNKEDVKGMKAEKLFVRESIGIPKDVKPNDRLNISFNSNGKVEEVTKGAQ